MIKILLIIFIFYLFMKYKEKFLPTSGHEPKYDPEKWNLNNDIEYSHNCYAYALDDINESLKNDCIDNDECDDLKPQPGYVCNKKFKSNNYCKNVENKMLCDNPSIYKINNKNHPCIKNYYKIGLATSIKPNKDYHFYRQDKDSFWSHKPGGTEVISYDASYNIIEDPEISNRDYVQDGGNYNYNDWCGFYCVPSNDYFDTKYKWKN